MSGRELSHKVRLKINKLVRRECCHHENGNCLLLDDGETHSCPQLISRRLFCKWFERAVLPLDTELEKQVKEEHSIRVPCAGCGKEIIKSSNKKKFCEACAIKRKRKQSARSLQKIRGSNVRK